MLAASRPRGVEREAKSREGEPKRPLPSPPTIKTISKEDQQHLPSPPRLEAIQTLQQPQESDAIRRPECKRKRSQEDHDPDLRTWHEATAKRARTSLPGSTTRNEAAADDTDRHQDRSIERWIETIPEPECSVEKILKMSRPQVTKKRSSSHISYSQGVKEGIYPAAHTAAYEKRILESAGIFLDLQIGEATIGHDARELCQVLLQGTYDPPPNSLFEGDLFWKVMNGVRNEGEGRVVRDLQPNLVPSAEILSFRGLLKVNYLKETVKMPWNNVISLAGSTPCPDFAVGLLPSAFTELELDKLHRCHSTPNTPSFFTEDLCFPFFTCEAKCGANGLNESDRQNARSAGTAIKAIYELYQRGEETRRESGAVSGIDKLHREILFFSISHDHTWVEILGHYPLMKEDKTYYYRHLVDSFNLTARDGQARWTAYNFIRKLYDHFAPIHLKRIQDAIPYLPEPNSEFISTTSVEEGSETPNSQEIATSASSPQGTERAKQARLKPTAMLQQENDWLKKDREDQKRQFDALIQENRALREEISKLTQGILALTTQS